MTADGYQYPMKYFPVLVHGFILTAVNVGAVLSGFACYKLWRTTYQLAVQVPVAVVISVGAFALWYVAARRLGGERLSLRSLSAYAGTYVLAFAWLPAVFVPLHYVTQGYLTSFANICHTWLFQTPTNVAALAAASLAGRRRSP